jgi:hypothetical protein
LRALGLILSLLVIAAVLSGIVYLALPYLTSKPPSVSRKAREIVIGLDISKSNPLTVDPQFAAKVAARVGPMIEALKLRDEIKVRTLGAFDPREQPFHIDEVITTDNLPEDSARIVRGIIAGVPTLIARGTLKAQGSTNLLGFLENMAQVVDCKRHEVTIVLASDGIEESEEVRLGAQSATLPKPASPIFKGCKSLQILGLGAGAKSPARVARLRDQWAAWADAAGFKEFQGLNDW